VGSTKAGVLIAVRPWVGLSCAGENGAVISVHHALAGKIEVPGYEPFLAVSAYLHDTQGLSDENLGILANIGSCVAKSRMPFLLGADFNMSPAQVEASGFLDKVAAAVVVDMRCSGTCRGRTGSFSTIDFFVASKHLAMSVAKIKADMDTAPRPHRPVAVWLGGSVDRTFLGLRQPRGFPLSQPSAPGRRSLIGLSSSYGLREPRCSRTQMLIWMRCTSGGPNKLSRSWWALLGLTSGRAREAGAYPPRSTLGRTPNSPPQPGLPRPTDRQSGVWAGLSPWFEASRCQAPLHPLQALLPATRTTGQFG